MHILILIEHCVGRKRDTGGLSLVGHISLNILNIAKGTTDPGVDCFDQEFWFSRFGSVCLVILFGLVGSVWQVWLGRFGLVGLIW